jgi:hypothetical protein
MKNERSILKFELIVADTAVRACNPFFFAAKIYKISLAQYFDLVQAQMLNLGLQARA